MSASEIIATIVKGDDIIIQAPAAEAAHMADLSSLHDKMTELWPEKRIMFIAGHIDVLTEADMNAAGWYRKDEQTQ